LIDFYSSARYLITVSRGEKMRITRRDLRKLLREALSEGAGEGPAAKISADAIKKIMKQSDNKVEIPKAPEITRKSPKVDYGKIEIMVLETRADPSYIKRKGYKAQSIANDQTRILSDYLGQILGKSQYGGSRVVTASDPETIEMFVQDNHVDQEKLGEAATGFDLSEALGIPVLVSTFGYAPNTNKIMRYNLKIKFYNPKNKRHLVLAHRSDLDVNNTAESKQQIKDGLKKLCIDAGLVSGSSA
jgi:hypothetical protein